MGPAVNSPSPVMEYESPLSVTDAAIKYNPFGPSTVPSKLDKEPFCMDPDKLILFPAISVSTLAAPERFSDPGSILNALSASITAVNPPWTGPIRKDPEPLMV